MALVISKRQAISSGLGLSFLEDMDSLLEAGIQDNFWLA
jgi:hypothetical protein